MENPVLTTTHIPNQRLILHALGQSDDKLTAHLAACATCRARADSYRTVLAATRETLQAGSSRVNFVAYEGEWLLESAECRIGDSPHTLLVGLCAVDDFLHGHLTVDESCTCWQDAPVRLFGPHGLVASGRVDANGDFRLPKPVDGKRYSLGLVLTRHNTPELQIIGSFQVR
jgi:hypothetical protein